MVPSELGSKKPAAPLASTTVDNPVEFAPEEQIPGSVCYAPGTNSKVPTFENWIQKSLEEYQLMLATAKDPQAEDKIQKALLHVSTLQLGAHAFDFVKEFFQRREEWPPVKLCVAEDNGAVIKALAKGRSPKLRHVARAHRVNLDWCYGLFRYPEVMVRYVSTKYQIADLGAKAIAKGETWQRLVALMGINPPGRQKCQDRKDVTTNKVGKSKNDKK